MNYMRMVGQPVWYVTGLAARDFDHLPDLQPAKHGVETRATGSVSAPPTNDLGRAYRSIEKLKFGIVGVNDINPTGAAAPFGGVKASGLGREGGQDGITEYLDTKLVGLSF